MSSQPQNSQRPYAIVIGLDGMNGIQTARLLAGHNVPVIAVAKDPEQNAIIVGPREMLLSSGLIAGQISWLIPRIPQMPLQVEVKIRYNHKEVPALIQMDDDVSVRVDFEEPQMAVAPGQSAVFFDGDVVLGGGIIEKEIKNDQ